MSIFHGKSTRRILPRWRASIKTGKNSDFAALKEPPRVSCNVEEELRQQADDFAHSPLLGTAAEFLSTALLAGKTDTAAIAASFILEHQDKAPHALIQLAQRATGNTEELNPVTSDEQIAKTRRLLRINPKNPVLWSDMARHFAGLGDKREASRCMKTALHLAPDHRWILRTAARFLVHQDDPVAAHTLLAKHPRTKIDPWLMAAELACAQVAGRAPKFWKQAGDILRWDRVSPVHISELATAVAMMELESGERKKARKYVHKSLIAPTENTLAQIFWAKENRHLNDGFGLDELVKSANDAYEADFQVAVLGGDLLRALVAAQSWSTDEPFAARPCVEIAYIASLLDNHDLTIKMAHRVKQLDGRSDPSLELNAIFSTLSSGKLNKEGDWAELEKIKINLLRTIEQKDVNTCHAVANLGLWHYRYGDALVGRELYQQAISNAQKTQRAELATMAAIFAAREAILSSDPSASAIFHQAQTLAGKTAHKASDFYIRKLDELILNPSKADEILSPSSAEKFLSVKKITGTFRVEQTKEGLVLWVPKKQ
jgi:tetratricopeptide (TPR) repeat protein